MKPSKDDVETFFYRYRRDLAQARDYVMSPELVRTEWKQAMGTKVWKRLREAKVEVLAAIDKLVFEVADNQP